MTEKQQRERGAWVARQRGGGVYLFSSEIGSLRKAVQLGDGFESVFVPYGEDARWYEAPEDGTDG